MLNTVPTNICAISLTISYSAQKESRFPARGIWLHHNGVDKHRQSKHFVRCRPWKNNGVTTHIQLR